MPSPRTTDTGTQVGGVRVRFTRAARSSSSNGASTRVNPINAATSRRRGTRTTRSISSPYRVGVGSTIVSRWSVRMPPGRASTRHSSRSRSSWRGVFPSLTDASEASPIAARSSDAVDPAKSERNVVPSPKPDNLERLDAALDELEAVTPDGHAASLEANGDGAVMALSTSRGELKIVQQPEGTRGYEDLRRAATREPLGRGIRPAVASVDDLARMLAALGREEDLQKLRDLRRLAELELGRGVEL
jgi:hypothetical protein